MPGPNLSPARDVEDEGLSTDLRQGLRPNDFSPICLRLSRSAILLSSFAHLTVAICSVSSIHLSLSNRSSARAAPTGEQSSTGVGEYLKYPNLTDLLVQLTSNHLDYE